MRLAQGKPKGLTENTEGLAKALLRQFQELGRQYRKGETVEGEIETKAIAQTPETPDPTSTPTPQQQTPRQGKAEQT
jgi:hypothetical protein